MNLYLGNLSFNTTEKDITEVFAEYGEVVSVNIIKDRDTGEPRGFAFVEMRDSKAGREAIERVNQREIGGRSVTVNEARPREERRGGNRGR